MKRSWIKRGKGIGIKRSKRPLKRSKLAKTKVPISRLQRQIWELCKQIIRKRYGNMCYTCGQKGLTGSNWHTSHFIPKAACGAFLKYDLRNLRPSCYHCNINLGGNGAEYYRKMVEEIGQEKVDELFRDKQVMVKAYDHYLMILNQYKKIYESLYSNNKE